MPRGAQSFTGSFFKRDKPSAAAATTGISTAVTATTAVVTAAAAAQEKDKNDNPRAVAVREVASHGRFLLSSYTTYYGRKEKSVTASSHIFCFLFTLNPDKRKHEHHNGENNGKRKACLYVGAESIGNSTRK